MEISFFPFCANKFRKRIPGLAFRVVIGSNGFSWCFSHSLDHDPILWHLFPDSLAVAVVRKMCKSFDSRKLPVPSRQGGKKWELALGPSSLAIVTAEPASKNDVDGWSQLFCYFMKRFFLSLVRQCKCKLPFIQVTIHWEALMPCMFSTPHHIHVSSCLFEAHIWDTNRNSGVSEFCNHIPGMVWAGHFQVQTQEWRLVLSPIHSYLHTLGHARGILLYLGMVPIRGAAGFWQQKNLCFSHSLMSDAMTLSLLKKSSSFNRWQHILTCKVSHTQILDTIRGVSAELFMCSKPCSAVWQGFYKRAVYSAKWLLMFVFLLADNYGFHKIAVPGSNWHPSSATVCIS